MANVTDPVCGMQFDSSQAEAQTTHEGTAYFFCSEECRKLFEANPEEYIGNTADSSA
ncbi:MAG: YHS domain-containing protein [Chloroflexia bacterium]|jgi:Cu+-exporting ATPase|nr:YHS domain-containing protein [Chloroflexia bacterium]